jgi:acetoin utilization protein AcuB
MKAGQPILIERRMKFMPCTLEPSDSVAHARALLDEQRIHHLPVVSRGRLVGIVSSRDLQASSSSIDRRTTNEALERHPNRITVGSIMTTHVYTAQPSDSLNYAAELMLRKHIGALPILEQGRLVAIIDRSDIVDAFLALASQSTTLDGQRKSCRSTAQSTRTASMATHAVVRSRSRC